MKLSSSQAKEWVKKGIIKNKADIEHINSLSDPKKNKFGAVKCEYNGITFDSKLELNRYKELLLLEKAGLIENLTHHEVFILVEGSNRVKQVTYEADFTYFDKEKQYKVVEDAKSEATAKLGLYRMKKKMMFEVHGITIKEVYMNKSTYKKKK